MTVSNEGFREERGPVLSSNEERLWGVMRSVGTWVGNKVHSASGGRIRLASGETGGRRGSPRFPQDHGNEHVVEGAEDEFDDGVELEDR